MYKLTDTMLQNLKKSLVEFHKLFQGGRCQSWQLEELLVKAIRSDFSKAEKVIWKGNGHDIDADIIVNDKYHLQIKSGQIQKEKLILSGHRLGRFKGNLQDIASFLNGLSHANYIIVSIPHTKKEDNKGITHIYKLFYIDSELFAIDGNFEPYKKSYRYTNKHNVTMQIRPSMSWQIGWNIPIEILHNSRKIIEIN